MSYRATQGNDGEGNGGHQQRQHGMKADHILIVSMVPFMSILLIVYHLK